jgi:hypothetical protein
VVGRITTHPKAVNKFLYMAKGTGITTGVVILVTGKIILDYFYGANLITWISFF